MVEEVPWYWLLAGWIVCNCGPMWLCIFMNRRSRYNEARDRKYYPFARIDSDTWSYTSALFTHFFFIPRYLLCYCFCFGCAVIIMLMMIGQKRDAPFSPWRNRIVRASLKVASRMCLLIYGMVWVQKKRVSVDYSSYLGPTWNPKFDGAGTYVCNHNTFSDILLQLILCDPIPGYLAKTEVRDLFFVGYISECI